MMKELRKKSVLLAILAALAVALCLLAGCAQVTGESEAEDPAEGEEQTMSADAEDINLRDTDGGGWSYLFTYKGEDFTAIYTYDNWCVYDSYKITSSRAMKKICQALIDEHPVHGSDYESFRTAKDMAYEWKQHNIAHSVLPDDNPWKTTTGNVDFDPEDQGKSVQELYEDRTGEEFNFSDHSDDIKRYLERIFE